jgi:hypothetical protein
MSNTSTSKNLVLGIEEWNTSSVKYMQPKINDKGMKSISIISKQTNRALHISTPLMMTWGVSDFVDDKGDSDGKFSISLNFPNEEYKNESTDRFLKKLKDFENQILDDAVRNSEVWWGEEMSREVAKHTFFPFLKYSKNRDTKKIDLTKPPSIRAKVPFYSGKWNVEIYDTKSNMIFPCENEHLTPVDFIPKMSSVACVLNCNGIWIGGKGWGLTWKLIQCVVKPRVMHTVYGTCNVKLSNEDRTILESQVIVEDEHAVEDSVPVVSKQTSVSVPPVPTSTIVEDSDEEEENNEVVAKKPAAPVAVVVTETEQKQEPVITKEVEQPVSAAPAPVPVKKIIKKKPTNP